MSPLRTLSALLVMLVTMAVAIDGSATEERHFLGLLDVPVVSRLKQDVPRSRQKRSCSNDVMTMERFIKLIQKIEQHPSMNGKTAKSVSNYLRSMVATGAVWYYFCSQLADELPDNILTTSEMKLLKDMLVHNDGAANRELGVVLTDAMDTIALGHVITGISCGGFARDADLNLLNFLTSAPVDNLYATTISGDLGQTSLFYHSQKIKTLLGPSGSWDSASCPKIYTMSTSASEATDAEILGDIDGLLLGLIIPDINSKHLKLSQIFQSYYGGQGLGPDNSFQDGKRIENFKIAVLDHDLLEQVVGFSEAYATKMKVDKKLKKHIPSTVDKFYQHYMKPCSAKVKNKYTVDFFIKTTEGIESSTNYNVKQMADSLLGLSEYFDNDYYEIMLNVGDKHENIDGYYWQLASEITNRRMVSQGKRQLGVVKDRNKQTLAMGHVLAGIAAGLARNTGFARNTSWYKSDMLYGATVCGTLARSMLASQVPSSKRPIIADKGAWDSNCPPHHMLQSLTSQDTATVAAIIGDIDGFILGEILPQMINKNPQLKLSSVLKQYYGSGLDGDSSLSSINRIKTFRTRSQDKNKLKKETEYACQDFLKGVSTTRFIRASRSDCQAMAIDAVDVLYSRVLNVREAAVNYSCFGDIMKLTPTGASQSTASQDRLNIKGVPASNKLVDADLRELTQMKHCYEQAGQNNCLHPALIAALASRESRAGRLLKSTSGYGDNGKAYGIVQCDIANSGLGNDCKKFDWDSCEHIDMMVKRVFLDKVKRVRKKHPKWLPERQLQGGVAAYNFGVSNVQTWGRLDVGTTGDDYSNDVIARAQRLVNGHGWTYGSATKATVGNGGPSSAAECGKLAKAGDCDFYHCVDKLLPCGSEGYALAYGLKYCNQFSVHYNQFTQKGKQWVDSVRKCLMAALLPFHQYPPANCRNAKEFAFMSHPDCYVNSGTDFCEVVADPRNWNALLLVYDPKDFVRDNFKVALDQIIDTMGHCRCLLREKIDTITRTVTTAANKLQKMFYKNVISPDTGVDATCISHANQGRCEFYECFEKRFPCSSIFSDGHIEDFETPHCKRLYQHYDLFDPAGKSWVKDSQRCLMQSLLPLYKGDKVNCALLHKHMFTARMDCFIDSGFCTVAHSNSNEWALQRSIHYMGYPMLIPGSSFLYVNYYYRDLVALNRLIGDINCECHARKLVKYKDFYKMIQTPKGTFKVKVN